MLQLRCNCCRFLHIRSKLVVIISLICFVIFVLKFQSMYSQISQTKELIEDIIVNVVNSTNELLIDNNKNILVSSTTTTTTTTSSITTKEDAELIPKVLWIDLPNMFPWRHCVQEYNNILTVLSCVKVHFFNLKVQSYLIYLTIVRAINLKCFTFIPSILLISVSKQVNKNFNCNFN